MRNGLSYSQEDLDWMKAHPERPTYAFRPDKDTVVSPGWVNGMTAAAQWGYKANSSTRPKTVPKVTRKRSSEAALRARVRELEARLDALRQVMQVA